VELRTMLVMGLLLALPLVAIRVARAQLAEGLVPALATAPVRGMRAARLRPRGALWQ